MANLHEQFIIDESGKKKAVVLPIEDYEELLEDIHDLAVIAERKNELTISFDELKKRLNAIESLADNPFPVQSKKLRDAESSYRLRIGDFRVIYQVDTQNRVVIIYHIRHRKDAYRK